MINLKDTIEKYPECLKNSGTLKAYLKDLYPKEKNGDINIIVAILESGICDEVKKSISELKLNKQRFLQQLEDNYGYPPEKAEPFLLLWIDALSNIEKITLDKEISQGKMVLKKESTENVKEIDLSGIKLFHNIFGEMVINIVSNGRIDATDNNGTVRKFPITEIGKHLKFNAEDFDRDVSLKDYLDSCDIGENVANYILEECEKYNSSKGHVLHSEREKSDDNRHYHITYSDTEEYRPSYFEILEMEGEPDPSSMEDNLPYEYYFDDDYD